jgi:hypothetical protein
MKFFSFDFKETFDCTGFSKAPLYLISRKAVRYGSAVVAYGHGLAGMAKLTAYLCNFAF